MGFAKKTRMSGIRPRVSTTYDRTLTVEIYRENTLTDADEVPTLGIVDEVTGEPFVEPGTPMTWIQTGTYTFEIVDAPTGHELDITYSAILDGVPYSWQEGQKEIIASLNISNPSQIKSVTFGIMDVMSSIWVVALDTSMPEIESGIYQYIFDACMDGHLYLIYETVTTLDPSGGPDIVSNITSYSFGKAASTLPPMGKFIYSCSYTSKRNAGNATFTYNPVGYTPSAQEENHPSFGKYTRVQMAIDIPLSILGNYQPKPGDFFTGPDGYVYNVVKRQTNSIFFCRVVGWCPTLSLPLEDTVQYKQASCPASSSTGSRTVTHTNIGSTVAAAIEPMTADLGMMYGTKDFEDHFIIYLASDPSGTGYSIMQAGDLFVDQNSITYEILKVYERNRLDFLPAFDCVKKL